MSRLSFACSAPYTRFAIFGKAATSLFYSRQPRIEAGGCGTVNILLASALAIPIATYRIATTVTEAKISSGVHMDLRHTFMAPAVTVNAVEPTLSEQHKQRFHVAVPAQLATPKRVPRRFCRKASPRTELTRQSSSKGPGRTLAFRTAQHGSTCGARLR
jgi:hypothetical protein